MSYSKQHFHIVFSIKKRRRLLNGEILPRLREYIGGIVRHLDGVLLAGNGPEDHLHLLITLPPKLAVSDSVRTIKANTSKWVHDNYPVSNDFSWQDGYASFSVSHSIVPKVIEYIQNQQAHHQKQSFIEELGILLKRHDIAFDEQYIQ